MGRSNPMRRSMARVEFFACMESIESMLKQGYSRQLIYEELKGQKRISMAYVTFAKLIIKAANNELKTASLHAPPEQPPPAPPKPAPARPQLQTGPRHITPSSTKFPDPRDMNPEEAV